MSDDISNFVKRCAACTIHQRSGRPAPLSPVTTTRVFERISIDLTGPSSLFDGAVVLTIVDYFSRYPFAFLMKNGTSSEIIVHLRHVFSHFGLPEAIVSDNGTPFVSAEFTAFLSRLGIKHTRSSVYYPQANGLVERFHSTFKHRLARVRDSYSTTLQCAIDRVLFDIRATPAASTGVTPFSRLFGGRTMRTELSCLSHSPRKAAARDNLTIFRNLNVRRRAIIVNFQVGDKVLARRGKGVKFTLPGTIRKSMGKGAWLVSTESGERVYNQYHLLPFAHDDDCDDHDAADEAYDDISATPANNVNTPTQAVHHRSLRPRDKLKKPEKYMYQEY